MSGLVVYSRTTSAGSLANASSIWPAAVLSKMS